MYVRKLRVDGLKLLRDFELDFTRDGEPRMWTVLVGRNGLCKTAILRALALAASGRDRANQLAQGLHRSLVATHEGRPPKLLTATQLLERYFSIDRLYPVNLAETLRRYDFIASNPFRSNEEERERLALREELERAGAAPGWEPIERSESA